MKIAIPVDENNPESKVCISFGRSPFFLIHDTESKVSNFIENSAANSQGGAGIKAAQIIVDNGANVLITSSCGENAAQVFNASNIKIYKSINTSIKDNLEAAESGKLVLLNEIHAGFHGHDGR